MYELENEPCKYFNGKTDTPIYSTASPSLHQIFQLCRSILPENATCYKRPYSVKKKAETCIFNQSISKIVHPHDLESDDSLGASIKKESVRFYEVLDESNMIKISSKIRPENSSNGRIIRGTSNIRQGFQWLTKQADPKKMYALIRRSEDKKCKENGKKLCRTMTFIMPLHEYNITNKDIRNENVFSRFTRILMYTTTLLETLSILIIVQVTETARKR